MAQEALQYLSDEVPSESQTAPMHNSILEAALHSGDGKLALEVLQHVCASELPHNSRTAGAMLRIMVSSPKLPVLCSCARKTCLVRCTLYFRSTQWIPMTL